MTRHQTRRRVRGFALAAAMAALATAAEPSPLPPAVTSFALPEILGDSSGGRLRDPAAWPARRVALLDLFAREMYGRTPIGRPDGLRFVIREQQPHARGGRATRLRVGILFEGTETGRQMELLVYLPNDAGPRVPVFLGLNFDGNHTTVTDPDLPVPSHWALGLFDNKLPDHRPTEDSRGRFAHMCCLDTLLLEGWGFATAACGEIEPDDPGKWQLGVRGLAPEPGPADWGTLGAWAWGLSRAMDFLTEHHRIDPSRVVVSGFSRLGKAALWAAAQDTRFAAAVSHGSGAGGIALTKRLSGETTADLVSRFPHWFCRNFAAYAHREADQSFDQHQLAALVAPRPLFATSASEDLWSDPEGEFLTLTATAPLYEFLGFPKPLASTKWPNPGKPINSRLGYFLRKGPHDVTLEDWRATLAWANRQLKYQGPPESATARYARRLAQLPDDQRDAWARCFSRSDQLRRDLASQLAAETTAANLPKPIPAPAGSFHFDPKSMADRFAGPAGDSLTDHILSFQLPSGGWSKGLSFSQPRTKGMNWTTSQDPHRYAGTIDNRATTDPLRFLAWRQHHWPCPATKTAAEKGIDYLLAAQFPNGGFPQNFPLEGTYHDAITLNDDAMTHALELLSEAAAGRNDWTWLDPSRRSAAASALSRGIRCLLQLQQRSGGQLTIWAAQYDPLTLAPVSGRAYEPPALASSESAHVVRFLCSIHPATPEISAAISGASAWLASHTLPGDPNRWPRFYHPHSLKPIFPGKRDGKLWPTEAAMRLHNPGGYDFSVTTPRDLPEVLRKWQESTPPAHRKNPDDAPPSDPH
jgi:PelA/Pel-15E family pectate lyase